MRSTVKERALASLKGFWDIFNSSNYDTHVADDDLEALRIVSACSSYYDAYIDFVRSSDPDYSSYDDQMNNLKV